MQNPHGKNHAVFMCFAPKDNPKIAIACIVENAGFGGTWAAPVATLMIERYLKKVDTTSRPDLEKRLLNAYFLSKLKPSDTLRIKFINPFYCYIIWRAAFPRKFSEVGIIC